MIKYIHILWISILLFNCKSPDTCDEFMQTQVMKHVERISALHHELYNNSNSVIKVIFNNDLEGNSYVHILIDEGYNDEVVNNLKLDNYILLHNNMIAFYNVRLWTTYSKTINKCMESIPPPKRYSSNNVAHIPPEWEFKILKNGDLELMRTGLNRKHRMIHFNDL